MLVIGITGGVASGKSTIIRALGNKGVITIDADKLGHKAYQKGTPCYDSLVENFGPTVIGADGEINRRRLGEIVFSDKSKMIELNNIVWPVIRQLLIVELDLIKGCASPDCPQPIVAVEAAIMIEAGWQDLVSMLWVVRIERAIAKDFLMARNSISEEEAYKRIDSQISNDDRCGYATYVLLNDGSREHLEVETHRLLEQVIHRTDSLQR